MKTTHQILATALAAAALFSSQALHAESTYGYSTDGSGVSATANVNVSVTVPKMVLLRVGAATGVDTVNLALTPVIQGAPTPELGNSRPMDPGWDGSTLPSFTAPTTGTGVFAAAWTNVSSGATLSGSAVTPLGLSATAITVTSAVGPSTNLLEHPGATTGSANAVILQPQTLYSATWTYNVDSSQILTSTAGSYTQNVTYTASTL